MPKIISTNPAKNYEIVGEVEISSNDEIKEKVDSLLSFRIRLETWRY